MGDLLDMNGRRARGNGATTERPKTAAPGETRMQMLAQLAGVCVQAEREAWGRHGPEGVLRAKFNIRVTGLPPNAGPFVEVCPGLQGLLVFSGPEGLLEVSCQAVRKLMLHEGRSGLPTPDMGWDPCQVIVATRLHDEKKRKEAACTPDGSA